MDKFFQVYSSQNPCKGSHLLTMVHSFMTMWGRRGQGDGEFSFPKGVAIGVNGDVYVADSNNNRIQIFTADGVFLDKWGRFGTREGEFFRPEGIAIDSHFDVYVTDRLNHRIQKFDRNGRFITQWGRNGTGESEFQGPTGIAVEADDDVLVADKFNFRMQKFKGNGDFIRQYGGKDETGTKPEKFNNGPDAVAVDSQKNSYVTSVNLGGTAFVKKFTETGNFIRQFALHVPSPPHDPIQRLSALGIAVFNEDPLRGNNIMVSDTTPHRVQEWSDNLEFVETWGSQGHLPGQFTTPTYIAIAKRTGDPPSAFSSVHYVADSTNNRVQKFRWELGTHDAEVHKSVAQSEIS